MTAIDYGTAADVLPPASAPTVIVVCEHASNHVPRGLGNLGLSEDALQSHIAWDPGAAGVARHLSQRLGAVAVLGRISRLVYDCNRPPHTPTAVPSRSEHIDIPGNTDLLPEARHERVTHVYDPFRQTLARTISDHRKTLELMVTVHSFTPVFDGVARRVELGILHGKDDRFATAMMAHQPADNRFDTRLNAPYSARDGVAHTLDLHGLPNGLLNVMIEIRNDLIRSREDQSSMADVIADWVQQTLSRCFHGGGAS